MSCSKRELGWLLVISITAAITGCGGEADPETDDGKPASAATATPGQTAGEKAANPTVHFYTYPDCKNCAEVAVLFDELATKYKDTASFEQRDANDKKYDQEKKRLGLAGHLIAVLDDDNHLTWATRAHQQSVATVRSKLESHLD